MHWILPAANIPKLRDELQAAVPGWDVLQNQLSGRRPPLTVGFVEGVTIIASPEGMDPAIVAAIEAVLAAHNPATGGTGDQALKDADRSDLQAAALQMMQALGWNNTTRSWAAAGNQWDSLTAAQRTQFMRRVVRGLMLALELVI